jgi:glycosyltransferase involved in cell wall biosynthesis
MKICLVNSFYPPYIGGAETYVGNLARNLVKLNHDVTVYCANEPLPAGASVEGAVKVVRMRTPLKLYGTPLSWFPSRIIAERYDIIHSNFPNPYFAAVSLAVSRVKGVPSVLTWHNDLPAVTGAASLIVGLHDMASAVYLDGYSRIIATTSAYAMNSKILRRHRSRVSVIPNGVDTKRFNPAVDAEAVRERYHLGSCKTLVFVGALTTWHAYKGLDVLFRAFAIAEKRCDQLKLLVVGGGNMIGHYRQLAQELTSSGRITFAGRVDDDSLPEYYAASDFAVLPSKDSSEGFGLTLLEAMASGKAVIGSNVGGIPEVIQHRQDGILVPPKDPGALAEAICELYADDELRTKMGAAGREFAESHDWKDVARQVDSLYRSEGARASRGHLD